MKRIELNLPVPEIEFVDTEELDNTRSKEVDLIEIEKHGDTSIHFKIRTKDGTYTAVEVPIFKHVKHR